MTGLIIRVRKCLTPLKQVTCVRVSVSVDWDVVVEALSPTLLPLQLYSSLGSHVCYSLKSKKNKGTIRLDIIENRYSWN